MKQVVCGMALAMLLAACGGGGGEGGSGGGGLVPEARGSLIDEPVVLATLSAATLDAAVPATVREAAGPARCDVQVVTLHYRTPGVNGESANASGVLLLPAGTCAPQVPALVAYGRSTEVYRPRTLANTTDAETLLLAATYAAQGYAVAATDYLGFAKSTYAYHPYLHADSEATSLIDAIRAGRHAAQRLNRSLSPRTLLTGYSQGAHASMAAQRAIEAGGAADIMLSAAAHLAGPYNLSGLAQQVEAIVGYQYFMPYLVTSWHRLYGNVYATPAEAFRAPYAGYIEGLMPSPIHNFVTLRTSGLLPGSDVTANQARDLLFQPAWLAAVRSDAGHPLRVAARANDLLAWTPRTRTLLCGGAGDPTISAGLHQAVALASFTSRGATQVTSIDVDAAIQARHGSAGRAPTDPASPAYEAYFSAYHTDLAPPLCHAQARALFDQAR